MNIIAADKHYLVVGLGLTGKSCVRYLVSQGKSVSVIDNRISPPGLDSFKQEFPSMDIHCGSFDQNILNSASVLVMSPGVALSTPEIAIAIGYGATVTSDVELFLSGFAGKVIAITGSNAKSTVTGWLGEALINSGKRVLVAGNIGHAVLDFVDEKYDVAVLELSSFQLELISKLNADVATILNVSEDHLDRYDSMASYLQAKQRIYFGVKHALYNREDLLTQPLVPGSVTVKSFGSRNPDLKDYGITEHDDAHYLTCGFEPIMSVDKVSLPGQHNVLNALSVIALADAVGNDRDATIKALQEYKGLPHRCQLVGTHQGTRYFNDSKATNVGSTLAALSGLGNETLKNVILLLGGQGKSQNFSLLKELTEKVCKTVLVYGEDKEIVASAISQTRKVETLQEAFEYASNNSVDGDIVLLSPACASFDQFEGFEHRGDVFTDLVEALV